MNSDKSDFLVIVNKTFKELNKSLENYNLNSKSIKSLNIINTETDGWRVDLRYISSIKCHVELWFDRWTAYEERKLWYGFYSPDKEVITTFAKEYSIIDTQPYIITDKDVNFNSKNLKLNQKLLRKRFEIPNLELYASEYFYGVLNFSSIASHSGFIS